MAVESLVVLQCHEGGYTCVTLLSSASVLVALLQGKMVLSLAKDPSARLLKHVVRCYLRLSDNPR
jgi:hypothetical protein